MKDRQRTECVAVGGRLIGLGRPCFIVAEIGSNHNQSLGLARELISRAAAAGADAVKFQSIRWDRLYLDQFTTNTFRQEIARIELDETWYGQLADHAATEGVLFFSAPTYLEAIPLLEKVGVQLYKLASPQVFGFPQVVTAVARQGKPIILSTGYCGYAEVSRAIECCRRSGNDQIVLLHCVSQYPLRPEQANLRVMETLRQMFRRPIGFSDHTLGTAVTLAAVALGGSVIEKHVTLDRSGQGPDHHFALEMDEFATLVRDIRAVEQSLGDGDRTTALPEELDLGRPLQMRLVAATDLRPGDQIRGDRVVYRRAPVGILADQEQELDDWEVARPVAAFTPIEWSVLRPSRRVDSSND